MDRSTRYVSSSLRIATRNARLTRFSFQQPLLFIHGLGMGVAQYVHLVSYLGTAKNLQERPVVILIQPHISMSFFSSDYLNPPDQKRCCEEFVQIAKVRLSLLFASKRR